METTTVFALAVICVLAIVQTIYQSRTTWEAQRREAEMARIVISATLARSPDTLSIATTMAQQSHQIPPPNLGDVASYTAPLDNHRLVRTPLATLQRDELYDTEEDMSGL